MIDHHLQPEGFEDYRLWSNLASSTCELIYWFAEGIIVYAPY
jgi:phosphoesterase RecJ-like protein